MQHFCTLLDRRLRLCLIMIRLCRCKLCGGFCIAGFLTKRVPDLTVLARNSGGVFTESGDAELTDREIMAQGRHKSVKVLPRYVKRTARQVTTGALKRRATRTKTDQLSE